ncbi:DUF1203 domain-containing protein [Pseudodonghicola xiamenensis]|uniref:DUF1203 domain-containing protein n=1 Tax=Pseudodonghicola xiamenensis TaxID=337702 RepID=A0A8J3H719_9RHOB|nr:DUF1203 domain-containing protein [Pseudodonghicola xiamenensis]GHG87118.1 hypothetical protein GCM10010961_15300 [Pseudodonghicola xiamenensis]
MTLQFHPYDSAFVAAVRAGGPDANGQPAERAVSDGAGNPCRHCLQNIPEGAPMLILAARPFPALQPYAETGPIFLCAAVCASWAGEGVPEILTTAPDYLMKGYGANDRIVYGTGRVVATADLPAYAETLLDDPRIAYVDVRSARNNCFQARITRRS